MSIFLGNLKIMNINNNRGYKEEEILLGSSLYLYYNSEVSKIRNYTFGHCSSLISVNLPMTTYIASYAFYDCNSLTSINLPNAINIGDYAFDDCYSLTSIDLSNVRDIERGAFKDCYNLLSLYLGSTSVCSLYSPNAFDSTPISDYTASTGGVYGSIYVPASLYNDYITATNWTVYSSRFVSI